MKPNTQRITVVTLFVLNALVSIAVIPYKPQAAGLVIGMMCVFALVWFMIHRSYRRSEPSWIQSKARHEILFAMILASVLLLGSISTTLAKELELMNADTVKRISGVSIGVMLMLMGNFMPKRLAGPSECCSCATDGSPKTQRIVGWIFVLAGLLYAGVWMLLDIKHTSLFAMLSLPIAVVVIVGIRMIYIRTAHREKIARTPTGDHS
ncbi:MAG: hypothetical protein AB8C13_05630 [Phycisphaerales bacterium]